MSGLQIEIAELVGNPGARKKITRSQPVPGLRVPLGRVEDDEAVDIAVVAESVIEGVQVSGAVSGTLHLECSRCLVPFDQGFSHALDETFYLRPEDEEAYRIEGSSIDLEPMVRDAILLAVPFRPLHTPDCKGLCPQCGADRNLKDCGHRQQTFDTRWAPLGQLRELLTDKEER